MNSRLIAMTWAAWKRRAIVEMTKARPPFSHPGQYGTIRCVSAPERWRVTQRECNHSAFNGYNYMPSRYSEVKCLNCGTYWRTKAGYVNILKDSGDD